MEQMVLSASRGRPSLADVLPDSYAAIRGESGPLGLPQVDQVVVMLVDGLGAHQLRSRTGHARHLTAGWRKADTAFTFPSTTVAGVTTLTTGVRAGQHGMLAYTALDEATATVRNQLSGWGEGSMDPLRWQLVPTVFERMRDEMPDVPAFIVGLPDYVDSGLTRASLRGAHYRPAGSIADRMQETLRILQQERRCVIYLYIAELDQAGHAFGWQSDEWLGALETLDAAASELFGGVGPSTGILVTADHGMLDIARQNQIDIEPGSELREDIIAIAGEPRLRHLYVQDRSVEVAKRVAERWTRQEGSRATVLLRDEAIAAGWYGPIVAPDARSRIGDVIIAARSPVTYYAAEMVGSMRLLPGQHGSITPEETIVPLIRHGAFRR